MPEAKVNYLDSLWILDLYKFTSFLCSLVMWPLFFYSEHDFFSHAHFVTLFLVGNAAVYFSTYGMSFFLKKSGKLPFYYFFQVISLIGIGYSHQSSEFVYMAVIPMLMSMHYFFVMQGGEENLEQNKSVFLYAMVFCGLLLFESFKSGVFFSFTEVIALVSFAVWSLTTAFFAFDFYFKGRRKTIAKLFHQGQQKRLKTSKNEKFFFHDLINHIHSTLLFLNMKKEENNFDRDEIQNVINELKLMQESVHNHFGFNHKNLTIHNERVPFHMAMGRVYNLIDTYFGKNAKVKITLLGKLKDENLEVMRSCQVDLVIFHRIMTNILKNAYEAHSRNLECIFDYDDIGMNVTVRNNITEISRDNNLDEKLGNVILNFKPKNDSVGLESIIELCQAAGGSFDFKVEDKSWVSHFFLPSKELGNESIFTAS
jgi:hypothetical protein